jgi:hypothetical protein
MQRDMTMEKNRLNHFLLLGTINHLTFAAIIFLIYALAGFKSSGDDLGGLMMVYALTLFMPQFVFGIFTLATVATSLKRNRGIVANRNRFNFYIASLIVATVTFIIG